MKLGALLREYEIRPDTIRFAQPIGQAKGYRRAAFLDAWQRYCPDDAAEPSQPYQPSHGSSEAVRLDNVVRLKPYQAPLNEMPPPPDTTTDDNATGTA